MFFFYYLLLFILPCSYGFLIGHSPFVGIGLSIATCIVTIALTKPIGIVYFISFCGWIGFNYLTKYKFLYIPGLPIINAKAIWLVLFTLLLGIVLIKNTEKFFILLKRFKYFVVFYLLYLSSFFYNFSSTGTRFLLDPLYIFFVMCAIVILSNNLKQLKQTENLFIKAGMACLFIGILLDIVFDLGLHKSRFDVPWIHPTPFSFFLVILFAYFYVKFRIFQKRRHLLISTVFGVASVFTLVRITLISLGVIIILTEWCISKMKFFWKTAKIFGLSCLIAVIFISLSLKFKALSQRTYKHQPAIVKSLPKTIDFKGRLLMWTSLFNDYRERSAIGMLFGEGLGAAKTYLEDRSLMATHSDWLRLLYDNGIVTVVFLIFALLKFIKDTINKIDHNDKIGSFYALFALTSIVTFIITMITDNPLWYYKIFGQYVFISLGLHYAYQNLIPKYRRDT